MEKRTLTLQPSEAVIVQAAANIYAAYISTGNVTKGTEKQWMQQSIDEALWIGLRADDMIVSDHEMG